MVPQERSCSCLMRLLFLQILPADQVIYPKPFEILISSPLDYQVFQRDSGIVPL